MSQRFPGLADRIRERLRELGYWRRDGAPDISRFCRDKGYDARSFYPWITKGRIPDPANMARLAKDLGTTVDFLERGDVPQVAESAMIFEATTQQKDDRLSEHDGRIEKLEAELKRVKELLRARRKVKRS